ncbi:hypothetical protein DES53_110147 [Roseimicrobium gellanilyticum]|uniref:Neutral/alkaline ceramidase-like enzyme n=1 Tax=Roseimicrobium gellanilyticum TaxID=748857 RepID=A0A366HC65_9BACT|nr:hypothetical protein [Roseimicrobium gellanilyticum]RBP39123.1 hypothetical protein DES53_110147 [Roseimicrobium gellanilyticum]
MHASFSLFRNAVLIWLAVLAASPQVWSVETVKKPALRAAALEFGVTPTVGGATVGKTGAVVLNVAGPLKSTITLLEHHGKRLCLVTTHFNSPKAANVSAMFRRAIARELGLPVERVLIFVSHNHTDMKMASNQTEAYDVLSTPPEKIPEPQLLPTGRELLDQLLSHAKRLPALLQPVTVWWAEGSEGRITYNRKGRRADGTAYLMREEDRDLVGVDYNGDIDRQAPIVVLKNEQGKVVTALVQFTGHPCTCYHPEKPIVFGDWPQVACDVVAQHLDPASPSPVSFLQGCAGDVNSKGMFRGDVALSTKYGKMLGDSYVKALEMLQPSARDGFDYEVTKAQIPLALLPSRETLHSEIAEMEDFIRRANAGDENTLSCAGLNFPRELSPVYRGKLIEGVLPWSRWALEMHLQGKADTIDRHLEVELYVIRLGDVGIVGMPFEPFQGIGRQMRAGSKLPLTIPCGYTNVSYGYLTDGPNTGDGEYMSAHYRYSRFRAPYQRPAGDVLATKGVEILNRFANDGAAQSK